MSRISQTEIYIPYHNLTYPSMKFFKSEQTFDYPWEQVSAANWQKYPNKISTHVKSVDVLRREFDPVRQTLTSERLIGCAQNIPRWLSFLTGGINKSYVREVSVVDLKNRKLTMKSCNLTWGSVLKVWETVTYSPDPKNPLCSTKFEQDAEIQASLHCQIGDKIEQWSVDRFGQNAKKGKVGFDSVLEKLDPVWNEKFNDLSGKTSKLFDQMNSRTTSVLKELNDRADSVIKELNDRKECALQDVNGRGQSAVSQLRDSILHKN